MLRAAGIRSARTVTCRSARLLASRPPAYGLRVRFESSVPPSKLPLTPEQQARKAALERTDDLQRDWDAEVIKYEDLKPKTLSPTPDMYLIDVREPDEVIQGMIPSAVNLPLSELGNSLHLSPDAFLAKHGYEKPKKDQQLIFYCRSGKRSATASDVAKRNGFTKILNYKGSWLEWVDKENKQSIISRSPSLRGPSYACPASFASPKILFLPAPPSLKLGPYPYLWFPLRGCFIHQRPVMCQCLLLHHPILNTPVYTASPSQDMAVINGLFTYRLDPPICNFVSSVAFPTSPVRSSICFLIDIPTASHKARVPESN
ncbi:putative rhodanese Homology domain containing protein [Lyophyllum shimeji]|uniref:Rhodanese Homology domain containing protein n=1 Tax=Lyophyllum shimeji TaxID=47721 RepID=A0A9P3UJ19_LYOSH|nr:putative rhodanese Homology domain containing protein [Lyophyllum shimeji]